MIRCFLFGFFVFIVFVVVGLFVLVWCSVIELIVLLQVSSFVFDLVVCGEVFVGVGYCVICYIVKGGWFYVGGYVMVMLFGMFYFSNIMFDLDIGIGCWFEVVFVCVMCKGVVCDGLYLFLVFFYQYFNFVIDEDLYVLYVFLMMCVLVKVVMLVLDILFLFNVCVLQVGWKLLFFCDCVFVLDGSKGVEWDCGVYFVEGLLYCLVCYSLCNKLGVEKMGDVCYVGVVVDYWYVLVFMFVNFVLLVWIMVEIEIYLCQGGIVLYGVVVGLMLQVIYEGLVCLLDSDIYVIVVYIVDCMGGDVKGIGNDVVLVQVMMWVVVFVYVDIDLGVYLYVVVCVLCYYNCGLMLVVVWLELGFNSVLISFDLLMLIQVILYGVGIDEGLFGLVMLVYVYVLDDQEIVQFVVWLCCMQIDQLLWIDLLSKVVVLCMLNGGVCGQY